MEYLILISVLLCSIATAYCAVALIVNRRREERWKESVRHYFHSCMEEVQGLAMEYTDDKAQPISELQKGVDALGFSVDNLFQKTGEYEKTLDSMASGQRKLSEDVENLKLDYREAQNAAKQINDYAGSLANIFNYDPLEARKKSRKESGDF